MPMENAVMYPRGHIAPAIRLPNTATDEPGRHPPGIPP